MSLYYNVLPLSTNLVGEGTDGANESERDMPAPPTSAFNAVLDRVQNVGQNGAHFSSVCLATQL